MYIFSKGEDSGILSSHLANNPNLGSRGNENTLR